MHLNGQFRYVCLDFETTWLDVQKDEPIQIGILEMDSTWCIIDSYLSYIKPKRNLKELKNIVQFITKIDFSQLMLAPALEDVASEISHFFWKNTILLGHNIAFDVSFLQKVIPDVEFYGMFDTFQLAQALIPYAPSYSLEILSQILEDKDLYIQWKKQLFQSFDTEEHYHDAFFDTQNTLLLFCYLIEEIRTIVIQYPFFEQIFQKSDAYLREILNYERKDQIFWTISLPPLKKIAPSYTMIDNAQSFDSPLRNREKYYIWNIDFKKFLTSLASRKNVLLVFSTKQKLDIAKNILSDLWMKNLWFAKEDQTISSERFNLFLNKKSFNQSELYFLLKYCRHLILWYGVLDLNTKGDFQIYNFVKDSRWEIKYPLTLTTQNGLYNLFEKKDSIYLDYDIFFFDLEWWYRNYNQYLSRTCDLYYLQNFLDILLYKYQLLKDFNLFSQEDFEILQQFDTFFNMFLGILRMDTKQLFKGQEEDSLISDPLIVRWEFYKTQCMLPNFEEWKIKLENILQQSDFITLWKQLEHFFYLTNTVVKIQRKMYNQSDFYFLFSEDTKFTNWGEFNDLFADKTVYFFSNSEKKYSLLSHNSSLSTFPYSFTNTFSALERKLLEDVSLNKHSFFILSTVKEESREIFEFLQKLPCVSDFELLVENITWGSGKNVFKAQKKVAKILVGGYNFLMMCYSQNILFDHLFIRNIKGPQSQLILDDIIRYAPKKD